MTQPEAHSSKDTAPTVDQTRRYLNELAVDGLLHDAIRFMVNAHIERYGLPAADREELQQDVWVEFAKAFKKYNPSRSAPATFARRVAEKWLKQHGRALRAKGRQHLLHAENWTLEDADARSAPDARAAEDARCDFESICTLLQPEDAELLSEFAHYTMIEIAQRRGINRGTVHRRITRIYEFLNARVEYFGKQPGSRATDPVRHADRSLVEAPHGAGGRSPLIPCPENTPVHLKHSSQLLTPADAALDLARAGVSVMPIDPETKKPVGRWKHLQTSIADERTLKRWFAKPDLGVALIGGGVSGNLEVLDFDCCGEAMDAWLDLLRERMPGVARHLIIELTPSGGFHVIYRCRAGVGRNDKLAMRVVNTDGPEGVVIARKLCPGYQDRETKEWLAKSVLIETRGEGGYCACAPTPGYVLLCGDLKRIPDVTAEERATLLALARSFDDDTGRDVRLGRSGDTPQRNLGDQRPGDDFSGRGDIRPTLEENGWKQAKGGTNEHWCRPGKEDGTSATLKDGVFYVFSSNAHPFEPDTPYSQFAVYTLLEHGGDFSAAASKLRALGYGGPSGGLAGDGAPPNEPPDEPTRGPLLPISAAELLQHHPELNPPLIHGLLRRGETLNLIASPKVGKSFLSLALALSVATGSPWLGRFDTEADRVLIVDNELHPSTSAYRIKIIAEALGVDPATALARVHFIHTRGSLTDIHGLRSTFEAVGPNRFGLVILDAFYRFLPAGTSENDNAQMASVYNLIDQYAAMRGSAFALVHHTTKGSQAERAVTDVGAGAGAQSRAADTHVVLRPHSEEGVITLSAVTRSWPPVTDLCFRKQFPLWLPADDLDPSHLQQPAHGRSRRSARAEKRASQSKTEWDLDRFIEAFFDVSPVGLGQLKNMWREAEDLSIRNGQELLTLGQETGRLVETKLQGRGAPKAFVRVDAQTERSAGS